ncbi:hypothetical protein TNCV_3174031 [Trichonephila clavipes]|nr:hypothetical protein TNCV_3174031 [Trichonephila clavipes]
MPAPYEIGNVIEEIVDFSRKINLEMDSVNLKNKSRFFTPMQSARSVERLANQRLHLVQNEVFDWLDAQRSTLTALPATRRVGGRCPLNLLKLKLPAVGVVEFRRGSCQNLLKLKLPAVDVVEFRRGSCQVMCRSRHLSIVQNHQKPSCS